MESLSHSVIQSLSHWVIYLLSGPGGFGFECDGLSGLAIQARTDYFGVDLEFG
jgi:hypothetical protein